MLLLLFSVGRSCRRRRTSGAGIVCEHFRQSSEQIVPADRFTVGSGRSVGIFTTTRLSGCSGRIVLRVGGTGGTLSRRIRTGTIEQPPNQQSDQYDHDNDHQYVLPGQIVEIHFQICQRVSVYTRALTPSKANRYILLSLNKVIHKN